MAILGGERSTFLGDVGVHTVDVDKLKLTDEVIVI